MSRGTALLLTIAVAAAFAACGGSKSVLPGIGPPAGSATPTPAPTPTPTPTPEPTAAPACGDLFMKIIRPDAGANVTNDPQAVEAAVGHSVIRVDFYYHIDAFGLAAPSSKAVSSPPVLFATKTNPPWRANWSLPDGCGNTISLLAVGFDACGGGNDSGLVTVTTCKP